MYMKLSCLALYIEQLYATVCSIVYLQVLLTLRIQGKFLVYGGFVGVPGERDIRGVTD